jgi:hypothetical protein
MRRAMKPLFLLWIAVSPALHAVPGGPGGPIEFNRDVRPILSDKCFACHGPDAGKRQAGLRLDRDEVAYKPLASGRTPIVPGNPAESELARRIRASDPADVMPPPETEKSLSESEKALLLGWIAEGGKWQAHWAYLPLRRPELPEPGQRAGAGAALGAIDLFIDARRAEQGLAPLPEADAVTLLRRAHADLTGLPPGQEDLEAFLAETRSRPDAFERLADRLLASPAFGERLSAFWLDLARYADTVGYHGDQDQGVWPYRDYVIRSFNENRPFDEFTIEQVAGDLLPEPSLEQRIASGYNRLAMKSAEGGVQDKEYLAKYAAERVRAVSGAWLGSTLGCSECHDHKFDPFTTRDFYRFAAFWSDLTERGIYGGAEGSGEWGPRVKVPDAAQSARLKSIEAEIAKLDAVMGASTDALEAEELAWERSLGAPPEWTALAPVEPRSMGGAELKALDDRSVLASGANADAERYTLTLRGLPASITALRLEALPDESLPKKGPGRARNGNFVLTEVIVRCRRAGAAGAEPVALQNPSASHEQTSAAEKHPYGRWAIASAIDGDAKGAEFGWAILDSVGRAHEAVFELADAIAAAEGGELSIELVQSHGQGGHNLGRFRLSATASPKPVRVFGAGLPEAIVEILRVPRERRSDEQRRALSAQFRGIAPSLEPERKRLAELRRELGDLEKRLPTMLVTVAMPSPRAMRVLPRGNWMDDSGEAVAPGVPHFLPQLETGERRATRLDLARWLVAPENPLTPRAFANRIWKLFFGAGLSRRLEDLGSQGEWPSHPELLDWLAAEFRGSGWDVKRLVKTIVGSRSYRLSSAASADLLARDPYNRWLARQARFRLDAELVRDAALAASGLLTRTIGGPSARPYQPPGYWAYLNFPAREWQNDAGENQYRRGLYTHWQRQYLHPSLLAFDAPSREECVADRTRSNTPLQALVLLNDPSYVEAARAFAGRILRLGGASPQERLAWAFREALSRAPRPEEAELLLALAEKHLDAYRRDPKAAAELLGLGQAPSPAGLDPSEHAAWTSVARALFNLHAFITRS